MGQEASLPISESLDEQARAPPSTPDQHQHNHNDNPSIGNGSSNGRVIGLMNASNSISGHGQSHLSQQQHQRSSSSRKIMGAMFRGGAGGNIVNNLHQQHNDEYEQREVSRNAALGGHLYDGTSDELQSNSDNGVASYSVNYNIDQQSDAFSSVNSTQPLPYSELNQPQLQTPIAIVQQSNQGQVGVFYEKQNSSNNNGSARKVGGLFSSRSTRGVINSMRNLSIASALRGGKQSNYRQKEVADWEKQWDEDDDNDDDDDGEIVGNDDNNALLDVHAVVGEGSVSNATTTNAPISTPQHYQNATTSVIDQYGGNVRFISTSTPGSPNKPSSPQSPTNLELIPQSAHTQTGLEYGQSIINPVGVAPGLHSPILQQQQQLGTVGLSPPRPQQTQQVNAPLNSNYCPAGLGVPSMSQSQQPLSSDFLHQPAPTSDNHLTAKHQQLHVIEDDTVDWDTGYHQQVGADDESSKPSVEMFMPMLRVLGKGSFGKVVLVQKREGKERGQLFAMKILKKTHLVKRRQIERTRTERKVLSVVNHPFIMKLHYAFQTEDKLYLVLDYCPGGELFFHLSRFRRFPERVARFYAAELLLAIGHLHKRGIIYRDLKPENVLLDAEGHLKLGDFGLAKAGIVHPLTGATSMCGTPEYMAPEVLAQTGHGFCVDYWGLGMLVYEMMTGLPPWYTTDRAQLFRRLKSAPLEIPTFFSPASANCVCALLERNPRRRLGGSGIRTVMEHEFFRNISWRALYSRRVEAPVRPCEGWKPPEPVRDGNDENVVGTYDSNAVTNAATVTPPQNGIELLDNMELDTATQNFDNQFTRMPVESEELGFDPAAEGITTEELNDETFLGFSFDIVKHREMEAAVAVAGTVTGGGTSSMGNISQY